VPADVLVVLDEAYTEYLGPEQRYDAIAWMSRFPNLLISRTFSKAYGLAGLRVGYGLGSAAVIDLLNRVRQPFNVSRASAWLRQRRRCSTTNSWRAATNSTVPAWRS
jgi:histidinol-phosphate aminotransferase